MGTFAELFTILDGQDPPDGMHLSPDPTLKLAHRALKEGTNIQQALDALADQIRQVRPAMRAMRFNLVESSWSTSKISALASDLHRYTALLLLKLDRVRLARQHLLYAIVCRPDDPNLSFYLVDAYVQEGKFGDGFALLDRTFEMYGPGRPEHFDGLYRLARDTQAANQLDEARWMYRSILEKPNNDTVAKLCRQQLAAMDAGK